MDRHVQDTWSYIQELESSPRRLPNICVVRSSVTTRSALFDNGGQRCNAQRETLWAVQMKSIQWCQNVTRDVCNVTLVGRSRLTLR